MPNGQTRRIGAASTRETLRTMGHEHYDPDAEAKTGSWHAAIGGIDVHFGGGAIRELGEQAASIGGKRALLVTDRGLVDAGHAAAAAAALESAGIEAAIFDQVEENPTTEDVEAAAQAAHDHAADVLVGLGGGSAMDCAKGANFLFAGGGRMEDYWGYGKARGTLLPSIGIPTTAGTGSEAQSFALVARVDDHQKMACGDPQARFRCVLLDPQLLTSLPRPVAAVSALDAVSHAIESFVTRRRNPVSQMLALEAWRLLDRSFEAFLDRRDDAAAGADMLIGAQFAGAAIEASMLGGAHACANPLTAHFGTTHGIAVGLMLPHVVRYNAAAAGMEALYRRLAEAASLGGDQRLAASERLARRLTSLGAIAGLPDGLRSLGIEPATLGQLANEAAGQWTGQFNPRPIDVAAADQLYRAAYEPESSASPTVVAAREAV